MAVFGKGGFPWEDAYRMPVRVRKLNVMKLQEILEKEAEASKGKKGETPQKPTIHRPNVNAGNTKGYAPQVSRPNTTPRRK